MSSSNERNPSIENAFKALELVYTTIANAKSRESNKHPVGDPNRVEADLSEIEKAHLSLLQSRLSATIAQENLKGMAESSAENRRFSKRILSLNFVLAAATVAYTVFTLWSVMVVREGNELQRQILQLQRSSATQNASPRPKQ